jgi:glutathione-regulated potassium-efflux system ancillary protein KefG
MGKRLLIQFAHPALERSRVNRLLLEACSSIPGVTVNDLYEAYPDFMIDVKREQQLLLDHDIVAFHHPFYWYSTPAILKEWQDLVLEHGFAYGAAGTALLGKVTFHIMTTGGGREAYQQAGLHGRTVRELLAPWEQTAKLCGMTFLAPFVVHGALAVSEPAQVTPFAASLRQLLEAFRDERVDLAAAARLERLNDEPGLVTR